MTKESDIDKFHNDFLNTFYDHTSKSMLNNFRRQNPHLTAEEYEEARIKIEKDLRAGKSEINLKF